jgi:hypothetical protein
MSELVIRTEWLGARLMADTADTTEEMRRNKKGKENLETKGK